MTDTENIDPERNALTSRPRRRQRRQVTDVYSDLLALIPPAETDLLTDLETYMESLLFRAPEELARSPAWEGLVRILQKHHLQAMGTSKDTAEYRAMHRNLRDFIRKELVCKARTRRISAPLSSRTEMFSASPQTGRIAQPIVRSAQTPDAAIEG